MPSRSSSEDGENSPHTPELPSNGLTDRTSTDNSTSFGPGSRFHFTRKKKRQLTQRSAQQWMGWEEKGRAPYHEYVHRLVDAGWDNLANLDTYMSTDFEDTNLVISVVDVLEDSQMKRHDDLRTADALQIFLSGQSREGVKVRLYMAEQKGDLSSRVIEAFGHNLRLDPRFFQWNLTGSNNLLSPADRHRAPFTSIGFTILNPSTPSQTDTSFQRITIYIQPDKFGDGWTGILLFNSHLKTELNINSVVRPPSYEAGSYSHLPSAIKKEWKSFRELYISSLPHLDADEMVASPFYAIHMLYRLNRRCWSDIITAIREQDRRIGGISEASVSHVEDIRRCFDQVKRGGSLGWNPGSSATVTETKVKLEEDFTHLLKQADFLWESREKMGRVSHRRAEARWTALTNAFTFLFVPVTVISGIYGMNVSEINGSTPDIWQFFVATAVMDTIILLALAISSWLHIAKRQKRNATVREAFSFALGR
ncbi:hypothetical protein MMC19_001836 [Ptychographa xylographoides]|nr:hypothetical protein [Ptychographa xylographoides]